jgi:phenylacetate-coenzyme A ligase PaaK-like adenylate-forming protein
MNIHEEAQITSSNIMVELGSCLNEGALIEAADRSFRIYLDASPALTPSPLYRTIWLKPMNRKEIVKYLQPMSRYLQTVSLGCALDEIYELSERFTVCGASRIAECGNVFFSYPGEPHDGVFALTKYCKRVSLVSSVVEKTASFSQLQYYSPVKIQKPIQDKDAFMNLPIQEEKSKLYVKSGGSSGKTILSPYSYRDFHFEMQAVAETLIGIGLEPKTDRVMNLLNAGHLYGGFLSFSCILEHANAKHFPMSEVMKTAEAVSYIIEQRIDVLIGMPSYLLKIFRENEETLKAYRGIRKVYYGGEFMTSANKQMLKDTFGVELISSIVYGSNDVGPIGYACEHSEGGVHHLLTGIMDMEILQLDKDEPVESGETGRIILSPKFRQGSPVTRYEIGDLGRWIEGDCPCGRKNPRFELTGRFGDIFRAGAFYFNYANLLRIIQDHLAPTQLQIVLEDGGTVDKLTFRTIKADFTREDLCRTLAEHNPSMAEALQYHFLEIALEQMNESDMEYTVQSRKLKHIIDLRKN